MKVIRLVILSSIGFMLLCPVFGLAPQKSKIAFVSNVDGLGIDIMNPDGRERKKLITHSRNINQLAWSPSGEHILFGARNSEGNHDIYIVNADGSDVMKLFDTPNYKRQPAWSPDGNKIAYMAYSKIWESWSIYVATIDGKLIAPVIRVGKNGGDPAWSPDGTEIAYVDDGVYQRNIYVYNIETQQQRILIKHNPSWMAYPTWSPDGEKIAFYWGLGNLSGVFSVNSDGTEMKRIVGIEETGIRSLTWSPGGKYLLYSQPVDDSLHLFKINIYSGKIVQLTDEGKNFDAIWYDPSPMSVFPSESKLTTTWGEIKSSN